MHGDHADGQQPGQQREGIEQTSKIAFINQPHAAGIETEGRSLDHIADGHTEDQRRHEARDHHQQVEDRTPGAVLHLAAIDDGDRADHQACQCDYHRRIEAGEGRGIDHGPGREDRAGTQDQPDLVALPDRADGIDDDAPLAILARHEGQQDQAAKVEAVGQRKADQQHAQQHPPDHPQRAVVEQVQGIHVRTAGETMGAPSAFSGPRRMYLIIR